MVHAVGTRWGQSGGRAHQDEDDEDPSSTASTCHVPLVTPLITPLVTLLVSQLKSSGVLVPLYQKLSDNFFHGDFFIFCHNDFVFSVCHGDFFCHHGDFFSVCHGDFCHHGDFFFCHGDFFSVCHHGVPRLSRFIDGGFQKPNVRDEGLAEAEQR
ncbi:unnamed protein product [Lampetra fluviatilis]